jgi:shikimate kinase
MNKTQVRLLPNKPIVLVGMMGCGKSAVGVLLAKALDVPFVDADAYIEAQVGMPIATLFETKGEAYFRTKEQEAITQLLEHGHQVIAVGGGAFIQDALRKIVKQQGISVWIRAEYDILLERLARSNHRPLLENGDKAAMVKLLMDKRYPVYAEADITVDTTTGAHEVVVQRIIEQLKIKKWV